MSDAKRCDRCGDFYAHPGWGKPPTRVFTDEWRGDGKKFDLCPDCESKLVKWLKDEVER